MKTFVALLLCCSVLPAAAADYRVRILFDEDACPAKTRLLDASDQDDRCRIGGTWEADGVCANPGTHTFRWATRKRANAPHGIYDFRIVAEQQIFTTAGGGTTDTCEAELNGKRSRYVAQCEATLAAGTFTYMIEAEDCRLDPRIIVTESVINFASQATDDEDDPTEQVHED